MSRPHTTQPWVRHDRLIRALAAGGLAAFGGWTCLGFARPHAWRARHQESSDEWFRRELLCFDLAHTVALARLLLSPKGQDPYLRHLAEASAALAVAHSYEAARGRGDRGFHVLSAAGVGAFAVAGWLLAGPRRSRRAAGRSRRAGT